MAALRDVARRHGLKLIEDAAQAHGASTAEGRAGSLGDVAGFSFQSAKNLSCGEGGALTTNDEELFERAYRLHNVGRRRVDGERWGHESLGWNCRPTEYQAALLLERFRRFEARQKVRRRNFATLRRLLAADVPAVVLQAEQGGAGEHGAHMFAMRYLPERCDGIPLEAFLAACAAEGAPVYRGYSCTVSQQPAMRALKERRAEYVRELPTPAAERIAAGLIYVPQEIFLGSEADMRDIAAALAKVARHYAARG